MDLLPKECKVVHSQTKPAWNVVGTGLSGKFKIARVPYVTMGKTDKTSLELEAKERKEVLNIAEFIALCINNQDKVFDLLTAPITKR